MTAAERYVAAAYVLVFALVLAYVVIIGARLQQLGAKVSELEQEIHVDD